MYGLTEDALEAAYPRLDVDLDERDRERVRSQLAQFPSIPDARIAWQRRVITYDEFMEILEAEERAAEAAHREAVDRSPPVFVPTPADLLRDVGVMEAILESRRAEHAARARSWKWLESNMLESKLPEPELARIRASAAMAPRADADFNARVARAEADIARRRADVRALGLRGLMRPRMRRLARREPARERRTTPPRRRAANSTRLAGNDPPGPDAELVRRGGRR